MKTINNVEFLNSMKVEKAKLVRSIEGVNQQIDSLENNIETVEKDIEQEILDSNKEQVQKFEEAGAECVFADIDGKDSDRKICEDDGTLHITIGKVRGCFISNQELTSSEWNKEARPIVKLFGFTWSDLNR
jgi:SMC interacting uncharacterized protein involved in chromosome segregation